MRHRVAGRQLNRDTKQRQALLKGLLRELVTHGSITTTSGRAKEIKRLADKVVHTAQQDTVANRRQLHRIFGKRDMVNTLVERVAPAMKQRPSGFTTTVKLGSRRGDRAEQVKIGWVELVERTGSLRSGKTKSDNPKKSGRSQPAAQPAAEPTATKKQTKKQTKQPINQAVTKQTKQLKK